MSFTRFLAGLDRDSHGTSLLGLATGIGLLVTWSAWLVLARVSVYEVSGRVRLEADRAAHVVQAPVGGRVVRGSMGIGREVRAGDLLVELDAEPERLRYEEQRATLNGLLLRMSTLRAEIAAEQQAIVAAREAGRASQVELSANFKEAAVAARMADLEVERSGRLREDGLLPELDFLRAGSVAEQKRAVADQRRSAMARADRESHVREQDRRVHLERLAHEMASLEGARLTATAAVERLQHEIDRRRVLAPASGVLGEAAVLRPGSVVNEGDRLGAVVPTGSLRAVAEYAPARALGRLRAGLTGRLRLEAFPSFQYGAIPVVVTNVAAEVRNGSVRVELDLLPHRSPSIPLQHGLPGSIEIAVERVRPATLVLRAAGRLLARPNTAPAGPAAVDMGPSSEVAR